MRVLLFSTAGCGLTILLTLPLGWREQATFAAVLILICAFLDRTFRACTITLALMAMSTFSTLRYAYWRTTQTWEGLASAGHMWRWDTVFVLLMLGAEFYAFTMLVLGYFQTLRPLGRPVARLSGPSDRWPSVDVLIPTYNEPLRVVRATVLGALAMDYPSDRMNVVVLDDGNRETFRQFATTVGAGYIAREHNLHAKAGNINHALAHTTGEYVAIFDADHVPTRTFLQKTLGWFERDPRLGLVQTPHHFYSPDPFERNLGQFRRMPNESELFHRLIQDGNDFWNASFFCGSCAVMRRTALGDIGGVAVETVTEDAHTALRMQRRGWNTAFINSPQAAGLATESLSAHIGQRVRWARGMVQILRLENPLLGPGLSIAQRLCYFTAMAHFLFAAPRLVFLTIPLVYLLLGMVNIYGYSWAVLAYALPHIVLSHMVNSRVQRRYRFSFWSEIYEAVLAPFVLVPTLLALVNPRLGRFNVTRKGGVIEQSYFDRRIALPFLVLLALNVAGLFMAGRRWVTDSAHHDTVLMNAIWTLYNVVILSVAASVAWERRQRRAQARVAVTARLTLITTDGQRFAGMVGELSAGGVAARLAGAGMRLEEGAAVIVAFDHRGWRCDINARVVRSSRRVQHLAFEPLNLQQEAYVTSLMYSSPEAWLSWDISRPSDRPLRSLLHIVKLSLRGLAIVPLVAITPTRALTRRRKRVPAVAAGVAAIALLLPGRLDAADTPPGTFQEVYEFAAIGAPSGIALEGLGAAHNLFFGVPLTKVISGATLVLRYSSRIPGAGDLWLWLNGSRVGSVRIVPGTGLMADVSLPTDLLTTDNTLTLQLAGSCDACAPGRPPAVVIEATSTLAVSGSRLSLPNDLSLLPIPFLAPTGQRALTLPVVFSEVPDLRTLEAAAIAASWFGAFADVRGARFPVQVGDLPAGNALVLASSGSLLAQRLSIPTRSGSLIAIRQNPRDPYGTLLIVAGDEPSELLAACRVLVTRRNFPQGSSFIAPRDEHVPAPGRHEAPRWLATDRPAPIGMYTSAGRLRLLGSGSVNVYFRLPPDLFLSAQPSVPLLLKFGYGGAVGTDAAVHIRLNGQDVDSIRIRPSRSYVDRAEVVRLPTGTLRPYANTLTVDFDFGRQTQPIDVVQSAAVHRDSSIDLRGVPHSVVLPRLELFADAGFPFTEWPDLRRTSIVVSNAPTLDEYEAALDVAGFFGAQTGSPATGIAVTDRAHVNAARDRDLVVLGPLSLQPLLSEWTGRMPLALSPTGMHLNPGPTWPGWLRSEWPFRDADRRRLVTQLASQPRFELIVEQFVSPFRGDRSVVAIVPSDPVGYGAISSMLMPAVRNGPVYGGVTVAQGGRFQSFLVGDLAYHTGDPGPRQRALVWLFEHYQLLPAPVVLFALLIALEARRGTERMAARRLASARIDVRELS